MSDYIKREDAINEIRAILPYRKYKDGKYELLCKKSEAIALIKTMPSADVVERKYGEWEIDWWQEGHKVRTCSYCKRSQTVNLFNGKVMFNFCPYCGADMRERKDNSIMDYSNSRNDKDGVSVQAVETD